MEEESVERIERIKREKMEFEEKLRQQNEDELRTMEKQHEEQLEKERMEGERKLQERKRKYAASQKKQQALQLDQMGQLDDVQRMEILQSFEDEQRRFLAMMSSERDRQLRALEEKLRNRRGRWESFCCFAVVDVDVQTQLVVGCIRETANLGENDKCTNLR